MKCPWTLRVPAQYSAFRSPQSAFRRVGLCMGEQPGQWALILGASSGMGAATARELARAGYDIAGIHLDRRTTMPMAEEVMRDIRAAGREAHFFNGNAADEAFRIQVIADITAMLNQRGALGRLCVLVHSLAFGAMRKFVAEGAEAATQQQFLTTYLVMADSLVLWTQGVLTNKLMTSGGRIFALTSAGGRRVWSQYGVISAAKAALEAHVRQLAVELAPLEITANAIQAGVTDTPALQKANGYEGIIAHALEMNPHRRLTTPEDVARAIVALAAPGTAWMTGNVIRVDGGEDIVA